MKVKDLIQRLSDFPSEAEVVVLEHCCSGCYGEHGSVEEVVLETQVQESPGHFYKMPVFTVHSDMPKPLVVRISTNN